MQVGTGRLASVGSLRGTIWFLLQRLSLSLWGPSSLGAISSRPTPSGAQWMRVCSSLTAPPPLATHPHRPTPPPIFHTLPHFLELAMPSSSQAFGPAGPCTRSSAPPPLERPQRSVNHAVSCLPPGCVLHPLVP